MSNSRMSHFDPNLSFYREQTLSNLRFLFGGMVEILTCAENSSCVIAFAYETRLNGECFKIMQTFGDDVDKALKALHDMSCKHLAEVSADCNHKLRAEHLKMCYIALPIQIQLPSEDTVSTLLEEGVYVEMPLSGEALETLEADGDSTSGQEEYSEFLTDGPLEVSQTNFTASTSVVTHDALKGYSVLLDIHYPLPSCPIGALRYLETPSRHKILQLVAQVLTTNDPPSDPTRFIESLSVRKGNMAYDILDYPQDDIGSLLHYVLESEKLLKIACMVSN